MTAILDRIGGNPVHVVAVDGQLLRDVFPTPPKVEQPTDTLVGVFTVQVGQDLIQINAHGLKNGDQVRFVLDDPNSCVLPFPLNDADYFFVANSRTNDFQVSSTEGGALINITDKGAGSNEVWKYGGGDAPAPSKVELIFVQSGRSTDLFVRAAINRKFGKDKKGQIWYAHSGFMDRDEFVPVDFEEIEGNFDRLRHR